ncbi:prephenate dehydratase domain-containing protein [Buchnera aphidicola]|uniref:Bifunctional chorismate mutase/prephenate dehydratase n=1 Tax=Buchnera aphidicola (Cinara cf. splendens/pseudotsugae 3390) TaxID=2518980 RepID=A0A451CWV4_9GAMM|nr:prephenate dehydratase domain-containing protein [Buchnera aphidicola]VFP77831.1 P-protein [Buchnera aphidicola (Cinara cf. splendens/pseudotsugae 3390)]
MDKKKTLELLRNQINNVDHKIIKLLSFRESLSIDILQNKIHNKLDIRDKNREIELFNNLHQLSKKNKINPEFIQKIFEIIVNNSILIQKKHKKKIKNNSKKRFCAYLGPIGSYSSEVFNNLSKNNKNFFFAHEHTNFDSIIKSLNDHCCYVALLPFENRISGIIPEVYEILKKQNEIYIVKEIYATIQHHLFTAKNCFFYNIKKVYSHVQPFKQCSIFLEKFPEWKKKYFNSTSEGMKKLSLENKKNSAVIGSSVGGSYYNLQKIAANISNVKNNITRFILISKKKNKIKKKISVKTTILITLNNNQENITKIKKIFKKRKIKITNIILEKNIINKTTKTYLIEIIENFFSNVTQETLQIIKKYVKNIKILGCYPVEKNITKLF